MNLRLFVTLMMVALSVLKLNGTIDLSWFWILLPIWIGLAILMTTALVALIALIGYFLQSPAERAKERERKERSDRLKRLAGLR